MPFSTFSSEVCCAKTAPSAPDSERSRSFLHLNASLALAGAYSAVALAAPVEEEAKLRAMLLENLQHAETDALEVARRHVRHHELRAHKASPSAEQGPRRSSKRK